MKNENTIEQLWENLKSLGEEEREFVTISEMVSNTISAIIKARIDKNMTQRDLAAVSGIKQSAIARLESINSIPRLDTLAKLAYHVGVTIDIRNKYSNNYIHLVSRYPTTYSTETKSRIIQEDVYSQYDYKMESEDNLKFEVV